METRGGRLRRGPDRAAPGRELGGGRRPGPRPGARADARSARHERAARRRLDRGDGPQGDRPRPHRRRHRLARRRVGLRRRDDARRRSRSACAPRRPTPAGRRRCSRRRASGSPREAPRATIGGPPPGAEDGFSVSLGGGRTLDAGVIGERARRRGRPRRRRPARPAAGARRLDRLPGGGAEALGDDFEASTYLDLPALFAVAEAGGAGGEPSYRGGEAVPRPPLLRRSPARDTTTASRSRGSRSGSPGTSRDAAGLI